MNLMPQSRPIDRKLTTILAADAANYSGRMNSDEEGTVRALRAARAVIDDTIAQAGGRIANTSGDGLIAEFPSVVRAVRCAIDIQVILNRRDDLLPFRLGVHLDDVIIEGEDLLGDGVNLAARLQEMAEVGGILVSEQVRNHVHGKIGDATLRPLGPATPRHLAEVGHYAVVADGVVAPRLLDNLGPKVTKSDFSPPETGTAPVSPAPSTAIIEARATFKRSCWRLGGGVVGLAFLDIAFGLPPFVTIFPTVLLLYLLYRKWGKLRAFEAEQA